jgi:hypothetical protein
LLLELLLLTFDLFSKVLVVLVKFAAFLFLGLKLALQVLDEQALRFNLGLGISVELSYVELSITHLADVSADLVIRVTLGERPRLHKAQFAVGQTAEFTT